MSKSSKSYRSSSKDLIAIVQHMVRVRQYASKTIEEEYNKRGVIFDGINKQIELIGEPYLRLRIPSYS